MLMENIQNLVDRTSFLAPGVQFSIGIGTCPTLSETIVRIRVDNAKAGDVGTVLATAVDILASLHNDRPDSQLDKA